MTIKQKLWVALGSISAIIFFIGILANSSFNKLDKQNTIYNSIASADNSMYRARLAQADYLLLKELHFKDKVDSFLAAAKNSLAITKEKMEVQSSIKRVSEIKASIDKYRIEFDKVSAKNKQLSSKDMTALFEAAGAAAASTEALLADEKAIVAQTQKNATRAILVSVSLTLIICVSLATWLIKSIMNPLTASMKIAERIADGDLTHAQPTKSNDEFSLLINALNKSTAKLREVISQIKSVISKLDDAGITVENAVVESYTSMHQQKDETTILAKSIMHVAGSSENIAQSVEQATTTSSETEREATQGNQKISDASAAMQDLYNELTKASESVNKLNDDSSNVADILDVISFYRRANQSFSLKRCY